VASVIRDVVSRAIAHQLNDPRVDPLTTVTRVEMVGDLEMARIYIAVSGNESAERRTLRAIRHAGGFLQRIVASELVIRQCPTIEFEIDESAKIARETLSLIAENRRNHPEVFEEESSDVAEVDDGPVDTASVERSKAVGDEESRGSPSTADGPVRGIEP